MNYYEKTKKIQDAWIICLPWAKSMVDVNGLVHQM
jgi:hypothetical protein